MQIGYLLQAGVPEVRPPVSSGPGKHVVHVVRELSALGHQVRLLAVLDGRIWRSDDLEEFIPVQVDYLDRGALRLFERFVRRIQGSLSLPFFALFDSLRFSRAVVRQLEGCDLLYERFGWMGYGGALASRAMGIPLVVEVNGDHLSEMEMLGVAPRGLQRLISLRLTGYAARGAKHAVAAGAGWSRRHVERWGIGRESVSVVENGSELIDLLARDRLRSFQDGTGRPARCRVAYLGAFEPWNGLKVLLEALSLVLSRGLDVELVLAGGGSQAEELRRLAAQPPLSGRVTFTGTLDMPRLAALLADADLGVAPYCGRVEYSGLKLIDYKCAGLAVIVSGEGGEPAVVEHGRTGWIVPPCDAAALADAIELLASDEGLRKRLGRQARIDAEKQHSWKNTAVRLEGIFEKVLASSREGKGKRGASD